MDEAETGFCAGPVGLPFRHPQNIARTPAGKIPVQFVPVAAFQRGSDDIPVLHRVFGSIKKHGRLAVGRTRIAGFCNRNHDRRTDRQANAGEEGKGRLTCLILNIEAP